MKSLMTIAADGSRSRFRHRAFLSLAVAALAALALYLAFAPDLFARGLTVWTDLSLPSSPSENHDPRGIWSDGTTMWVADSADAKIYAYEIDEDYAETGWIPNTRIPSRDFDTLAGAGNNLPEGLWSDGKTMWVADWDDKKLYAYDMTTKARDQSKEIALHADNTNPAGVWSDGTIVWVSGNANQKIYAYELDDSDGDGIRNERIPSRDFNKFFSLTNDLNFSHNPNPKGLWSDGKTMWVSEEKRVYSYNLLDGQIDHTMHIGWTSVNQVTHDDENIVPWGIWGDSETMWVADLNLVKRIYAYNMPPVSVVDGVRVPRPFGNRIVIEWNEAPRGDRYRVQWKLPSETWPGEDMRDPNNEMVVNRLNTPSATIAALCGKTYDVRVRTESGGGGDMDKGPWSDPVREIFTCEWTDAGTVSRSYARSGNWRDSSNTGTYGGYANYYTFELTERKEVRIALSSSDTIVDPHFGRIPKFRPLLFLRGGGAIAGGWVAQSENTAVTDIYRVLDAGTYTVEATNLDPGETGRFRIAIDTRTLTDPPATTGDVPDTCETVTLTEAGTTNGKWGPGPSSHEWRCTSIDSDVGGYTRFYDFFLERRSSVTITLESDHATPRVFLREGGNSRHSTYPPYVGQYSNGDSRIRATLEPGAYTIEAAANQSGQRGEFTLKVAGSGITALAQAEDLPAEVSCDETTDKTLTPGQTVNGQWGPGCERSDLPTRPDLRPCTGPGCVFSGLRTTAYTRYYDFNLPTEGGWKRVTITLTNNDKLPPDLKLREASEQSPHSRYLAYGEESGTKASKIDMDLAPGDYVIEALNLDYPDPFFAKTGQFTIRYTTSAPRVDCGRDIPGTGEVEENWFTGCESSVGYGYARFFTFTVPGAAGGPAKLQTIKVNTYGQVPTLYPALWLRVGDDNRTGGYIAQANGLRHTSKTHYSSLYGYSQLRPREANLTELSVNLAPGKYTVEVATGQEPASGHFRLNLGQGEATGSGLTALHKIPDYSAPDVREGPTKPEGIEGGEGGYQLSQVEANPPTVSDTSKLTVYGEQRVGQCFTVVLPEADAGSGDGGPYDYSLYVNNFDQTPVGAVASDSTNGFTFDPATRRVSGVPVSKGGFSFRYVIHDGDDDRDEADAFVSERLVLAILPASGDAVPCPIILPPQPNRSPTFDLENLPVLSVAENSPAGTNVGSPIPATDPDDDTLTYSLSGTDASSFAIDASTGQITTIAGVTYDYEVKSRYSLGIAVEDGNGFAIAIVMPVNLTDVDEPHPEFQDGTSTTREVAENSGGGVNVGPPVTATDPDAGDTVSYSLSGTDAASFEIGSSTGQITTKSGVTYDYESKSSYALTVEATDGNSGTVTIAVTVNLTDVNDFPEFEEGESTTRSLEENSAAGTNVGLPVTATDQDGDTLSYIGTDGADGAAFALDPDTGQLTTVDGVTYDYETKSSYQFMVVVMETESDEGYLSGISVTVSLTDVAEGDGGPEQSKTEPENRAPSFDANIDTTLEVAENSAAGTNVGAAVTATDPDDGDTLTYTLSGTDAASFDIGSATGQITTKSGVTYDYETKQSYSVAVGVSDGKGGTDSIAVTVSLTDVNEAPVFADGATATREVAENSAAGTNVGAAVTATDPDTGDTLTYTLSGTDAASFSIGSSTCQITTKSGVTYDYESKSSYSLTVGVSDGNGGTDSIAVTVNLTDVEETPTVVVEPDPPTPTPPTASAGADFNGKRGEVLTLSGSGTANAAGLQTLTYRWRISGASHDELASASAFLSSADSAEATFTMPRRKNMTDRSALDDGNWIKFGLTVTDGDGEQSTDTVTVTISGTTWTAN